MTVTTLRSACTDRIYVETDGAIARLTIDNAARRNALDLAMWQAIPDLCAQVAARTDLRVLLVMGKAGLPFCSGADISEFSTLRASAAGSRAYEESNARAFDALAGLGKPVIAVISGFCMGGGMGLAAACDMRVASQDASFAIPAGRLGVGYPPASMAYVVAAVGAAKARDLFYTGRRLGAQEAQAIGFIDRLVEPHDLMDEAARLAATIVDQAPLTMRAAKAAIAQAAGLPGAPSLEECTALADACFDSADYAEGRAAFLEKRKPVFSGR